MPTDHVRCHTRAPMTCLLATLIVTLARGASLAQSTTFVPGAREIFNLNLKTVLPSGLPMGILVTQGKATVVRKDGLPAIKVSEPTDILVQLPLVLPDTFTLELDVVPKACCNPPDLQFEGTASLNRGATSMQVVWQPETMILAGGGDYVQVPMPDSIRPTLPLKSTQVAASFQGTTFALYVNGVQVLARTNRLFKRDSLLRVSLGGQSGDDYAVYLSRLRISAGSTTIAAVTATTPTTGTLAVSPLTSTGTPPAGARATSVTTADCPVTANLNVTSTSNTTARLTWHKMSGKCVLAAALSNSMPYSIAMVRWDTADGSPCVSSYDEWTRQYGASDGQWKYIGDLRCTQFGSVYQAGSVDDAGLEPGHTYHYRTWLILFQCDTFYNNCNDRATSPEDVTAKTLTFGPVATRPQLNEILGLHSVVSDNVTCDPWYPTDCYRDVTFAWKPSAAAVSYVLSMDLREPGRNAFYNGPTYPVSASPTPSLAGRGQAGGAIYACIAIVTDPKNPPNPRKGECVMTDFPWP